MLKKIRFSSDCITPSPEAQCIIDLMREAGYEIDAADAQLAWQANADEYCGSWLRQYPDDEIVKRVLAYCEISPAHF